MTYLGLKQARIEYLTVPADELVQAMVQVEQSAQPDPWSYDQIRTCFCDTCIVLGLYIKQDLVGYAVARVVVGEAEVYNIGIMRRYQGQGLGSLLLQALLDACKARKATVCFLEVREHNVPAIALYQKFHFTPMGVRTNYYSARPGLPAENAITMRCDL